MGVALRRVTLIQELAMSQTDLTYQISRVAQILRTTRSVALRLVRDDGLKAVRTPRGLRVDQCVLAEWVEGQMAKARSEALSYEEDRSMDWHPDGITI